MLVSLCSFLFYKKYHQMEIRISVCDKLEMTYSDHLNSGYRWGVKKKSGNKCYVVKGHMFVLLFEAVVSLHQFNTHLTRLNGKLALLFLMKICTLLTHLMTLFFYFSSKHCLCFYLGAFTVFSIFISQVLNV